MKMIEKSLLNKDIIHNENGLFFGGNLVECSTANLFSNNIPSLYVVRVKTKDGFSRFVCGLDLMQNGLFWLGGTMLNDYNTNSKNYPACYFDKWEEVKYVLDNIAFETKGKDWFICEEEDFEAFNNAWESEKYEDDDIREC
jgi:hypothetical protein